jgi:hypothetical protein
MLFTELVRLVVLESVYITTPSDTLDTSISYEVGVSENPLDRSGSPYTDVKVGTIPETNPPDIGLVIEADGE